jgi:hypothetical protein
VFSTSGELDLPTAVSNFGGERCSRPAGVQHDLATGETGPPNFRDAVLSKGPERGRQSNVNVGGREADRKVKDKPMV